MNFTEYQAAAMRTAQPDKLSGHLVHASLGLVTEVGEFVSEVKRCVRYGKALDETVIRHMAEELGDVLWYIALAAEALDVPMNQMARENIGKLMKRFPEKFTEGDALARADKGGADHRSS